ncbi:hypothetical protein D3C87_1158700 [compost metagenome]
MALRCQIVNFVRLNLLNDTDQIGRIRHVAVVQNEARILVVRILIDVIYPAGIEGRRTPLDTVNRIALGQQKLGKIGTVLPGYSGYQRDLVARLHSRHIPMKSGNLPHRNGRSPPGRVESSRRSAIRRERA